MRNVTAVEDIVDFMSRRTEITSHGIKWVLEAPPVRVSTEVRKMQAKFFKSIEKKDDIESTLNANEEYEAIGAKALFLCLKLSDQDQLTLEMCEDIQGKMGGSKCHLTNVALRLCGSELHEDVPNDSEEFEKWLGKVLETRREAAQSAEKEKQKPAAEPTKADAENFS